MTRRLRSLGLSAGAVVALGLALAAAARRTPAPEAAAGAGSDEAAARLAARLLAPSPVADDLRFLCDRIGGRPTGSAACERAIDWSAERLRQAGADRAWTEGFSVPHRWDEDLSRAEVTSPEAQSLRVVAMPYSPPTPRGGLVAPVVFLGDGAPADFDHAGPHLRGAFGLVSSKVIVTLEDLFEDYLRLPAIVERAQAAGAAGLLLVGGRERGLLYRHVAAFGEPAALPMAILAREDGLRLQRLAQDAVVRLRLDLGARIGPAFESRNVLAEIKGRERPDEVVLASAHLDSWELGTGALDDGVNCVMLIDIARQMAALGLRPRRTVRFALFTGEEQGVFGSLGYVRAHRAELDGHAAMAAFDLGTGRITGFSLGGREDLRGRVEAALRPVEGFGATAHSADAFFGTDNFDFLLEGVPTFVANQAPANYMENYHAASDTFDKADLRELKINGAIAAALLWALADSPDRAARQDRAAIERLLDATGLAGQMKTFSLWEVWQNKARGRAD